MWWPHKFVLLRLERRSRRINGLPLPRDLLDLIAAGRWCCPTDLSGVDRLFPDRKEFKLYTLDYMPFENRHWLKATSRISPGTADLEKPPGDIDPKRSILIGDLGVGYDRPIALDYRRSMDEPPVLALERSHDARNNRWVEVARNVSDFAELVGLEIGPDESRFHTGWKAAFNGSGSAYR